MCYEHVCVYMCVCTHDRQRVISSVSWPPVDSICVHMQRWTYRDTHSLPHGYNCKCLSGSSDRTRPHPPGGHKACIDGQTHISCIYTHTGTNINSVNQAKSHWGKLGEVLFRGWVVFNNSDSERVMRHQDKAMWVNLWCRGDQISSMTDRQNESAMSWSDQWQGELGIWVFDTGHCSAHKQHTLSPQNLKDVDHW